jgi:uncharacterized damage-inducible protein DinB
MTGSPRTLDEAALGRGWIEWLVSTREGYLEALLRLPEPERHKDRGASFPSLQDIFLHILDDNLWWFESVPRERAEAHVTIEGRLAPEELRHEAARVAEIGRKLARSLTPARLNEQFVVRGQQVSGKPYEMKVDLRTIVWHMVEEELQHRGEMNALFWQMDVDAPTRAWFSSPLAG